MTNIKFVLLVIIAVTSIVVGVYELPRSGLYFVLGNFDTRYNNIKCLYSTGTKKGVDKEKCSCDVDLENCNSNRQRWIMTNHESDTYFMLRNGADAKCLSQPSGSDADIVTCDANDLKQYWSIYNPRSADNPSYVCTSYKEWYCIFRIRNRVSYQCVSGNYNGANVKMESCGANNKDRDWFFTDLPPTPRPTRNPTTPAPTSLLASLKLADFDDENNEIFNEIMKPNNGVKSMTCVSEINMWSTVLKISHFFENIIPITQNNQIYNLLKQYTMGYPTYYSQAECEIDDNIKLALSVYLGTISATNTNYVQNLLHDIYSSITDEIDTFSNYLSINELGTTVSISYSVSICVDVLFTSICYAFGFGFAFNFQEEVIYYKTGSQGITLGGFSGIDSVIPGSIEFGISYDVLGDISYVSGNSYSIDVAISSGMLTKISQDFQDYLPLKQAGYSFSYLAGVNNLNFGRIDNSYCVGFSFGNTLSNILNGELLPSLSFGVSRGATITLQDIEQKNDVCIVHQLWEKTSFGIIVPKIS
eukprot:502704_1